MNGLLKEPVRNMQHITDHNSIKKYSEQFSELILNDFFSENNRISGPEILELTPVRQVNLLIIKSLLFQWKKESEKLKSPFFDFSSEEVQKALSSFMNTVSRNISIDRDNTQPLLEEAVKDSILLIFFPYTFYTELINNWKEENLYLKDLKQISKYIKVNESLMNSLITEITEKGLGYVSKSKALDLLNNILESKDLTPADTEEYEQKYNQVLDFQTSYFMKDDLEENQPIEDEQAVDNTQNQVEEFNPLDFSSAEDEDEPELVEFPEPEPAKKTNIYERDEIISEEIIDEEFEEELAFEGQEEIITDQKEEITQTLNEDLTSQRTEPTIADIHEKQKIDKISKYISINQKFMFINSLFDKDWGKFEKAMSFLDSTNDKNEIISYLDGNAPAWREDSEEAEEFRLVLEKKLGEPIV